MKAITSILFCVFFVIPAVADWRIEPITDEMTDEKRVLLYCAGDKVELAPYFYYRPAIVLRISAAKTETMISLEDDFVRRDGVTALVRFGNAPAEKWAFIPSTDRHSLFVQDKHESRLQDELRTNSTVRIRYETAVRETRTYRFDVTGFADALKRAKEKIKK